MTVRVNKPAVNLREEMADLRNQGGYSEQQFYFDSLVTNGTFDIDTDWTKGTGWIISGGDAYAISSTSDGNYLEQNIGLISGKTYYYTITVGGTVSGSNYLAVRVGGTTDNLTITSTGVKTGTIAATGSGNLRIRSEAATATITLDNVAFFEVDANGDVIHTMPKGWKPKDVFEDGLLQREGAAHDYEVVYDGFDYKVKPTVAPSATTETCVIGVKA